MATRRPDLRIGVLSESDRRAWQIILLTVAAVWRVVPLVRIARQPDDATGSLVEAAFVGPLAGAGLGLTSFFTDDRLVLVGSPAALVLAALETTLSTDGAIFLLLGTLASIAVVWFTYRLVRTLLGVPVGLVAGFLVAVSTPGVAMGVTLLPVPFATCAVLVFLERLLAMARAREGTRAVGVGLVGGWMGWWAAWTGLWWLASLAWLPWVSRRFRGAQGGLVALWLAVGWLAPQVPIVVHNAITQRDWVAPPANLPFDLYTATQGHHGEAVVAQPATPDHMEYPLGRRARSYHRLEDAGVPAAHEWAKDRAWLGRWADTVSELPGAQIRGVVNRITHFLGGFVEGPGALGSTALPAFRRLPLVPGDWLFALFWLGALPLLGSVRTYGILYLGLLIPLLPGLATGLDAQVQATATPFLAAFAAYGLVQWWRARGSWITWVLAPAALTLGIWWVGRF